MLARDLPAGTLYAWGGDARNLRDATTEIWWVLGLAAIIVYMTLAAQFESLIHPLTVMLALPLAAVGAFGLLWLLDLGGKTGLYPPIPAMNINLFSQIGLVLLVGLVTKNSILLVEYANQQRAKGLDSHEAMIQAGRVRLRPILMTAFSTIAGILPIAIGFGAGDPKAAGQLLPLVYEELRKLAAAKMAQEKPGQTLQATALLHEAWLKKIEPPSNLPPRETVASVIYGTFEAQLWDVPQFLGC